MIEIACEGCPVPYKLHLHACRPAPDIQFEPVINMRYITPGECRYEVIQFRNDGRVGGYVSLEEVNPKKPALQIDPGLLNIQPDDTCSVRVGMVGTNAELVSRRIKVTVSGQED